MPEPQQPQQISMSDMSILKPSNNVPADDADTPSSPDTELLSSKIMEARDSISSIDSNISLSFDQHHQRRSGTDDTSKLTVRNSSNEAADLSDSGSSDDTGGKDSGCELTTPNITEPVFTPPCDELADKIVQQVEFYFSDANITKDAFLLKHVKRNKEGYVSLKLISSFKRVKHITKDWRVVAHALQRSDKLEINEAGTKLRRIHALPQYDETTPSRTVVSVNMPIERPTIENVAELFRDCGEIALIRILRPGNPIPADVRQFINKNPSLSGTVCALVEFVQSESARKALKLTGVKVYELNCVPHPERKKKFAVSKNIGRHHSIDSTTSDCSEAEVIPKSQHRRGSAASFNRYSVAEPAAWLQRRLSASSTEACFRRLSYSSSNSSRDSSESNLFIPRRVSACSLLGAQADVTGYHHHQHYYQPPNAQYYQPYHHVIVPVQQHPISAYYQRRMSACSNVSSTVSDYSGGASNGGGRHRSNSAAAFFPPIENVVRLPKGPDGSRGFGQRRSIYCD